MKLLLVNPQSESIYHKLGFVLPPLGIAYLAAAAQKAGIPTTVWDQMVDPESMPDFNDFDVIGLSGDSGKHPALMKLAEKAKKKRKTVIAGGPHVTFLDQDALNAGCIDFILRGEAEQSLVELLNALKSDSHLEEVAGLSYRANGKLIRTPMSPPPDLNSLPFPARDLLPMKKYRKLELRSRPVTPVITSRGCPFACAFCCSSSFSGTAWRSRTPDNILKEMQECMDKYDFNAFAFVDDAFLLNAQRIEKLCDLIIEHNLDILWWCFARSDTILQNAHLISKMARAGARYVFMGLESARQSILDDYSKGIDVKQFKNAVQLLKREGIETTASFIIGHPDDTRNSILKTAQTAGKLDTGASQFSILTPFPGTRLFEQVQHRIFETNWSKFDCLHPTFHLKYLNPAQLQRLLYKCFRTVYITPAKILNGLLSFYKGRGVKVHKIWKSITQIKN